MRASRFLAWLVGVSVLAGLTLAFLPADPVRAGNLDPYRLDVDITKAPSVLTDDHFDNGFNVNGVVTTSRRPVGADPRTVAVPSQVPASTIPSPVPSTVTVPGASVPIVREVPNASIEVRLGSVVKYTNTNNQGLWSVKFEGFDIAGLPEGLSLLQVIAEKRLTVAGPTVTVTQPAVATTPSPTVNPSGKPTTLPVVEETLSGVEVALLKRTGGATGLVSDLAVGSFHNCVVLSDQTARCWGLNASGQLGDGSLTNRTGPTPVTQLRMVSDIAVGDVHSCAIHAVEGDGFITAGQVSCWGGTPDELLLGTDTYTQSTVAQPVELGSSFGAVGITLGSRHACVLLSDTSVRCWGDNSVGQTGASIEADVATPSLVRLPNGTPLRNITQVEAGAEHTCARQETAEGIVRVYCWGSNSSAQLGNADVTAQFSLWPVTAASHEGKADAPVATGPSVITAGGEFTCVVAASTSTCWGSNASGQLGAEPADRTAPTATDRSFSSLTAGINHLCGLRDEGTVEEPLPSTPACSGSNEDGQLGSGTTTTTSAFAPIVGLGPTASIRAGRSHTCALEGAGVLCWGDNSFGQIGDGTVLDRLVPRAAVGLEVIDLVAAGGSHSCARWSDTKVRCWGANTSGQLGDGTTTDRRTPTSVTVPATKVVLGDTHSCAIAPDALVRCWGSNSKGQLGDGTTTSKSAPTLVTGLTATALALGDEHTCAIVDGGAPGTNDDSVKCWGANAKGQLGDGTTTDRSTPTSVPGLTNVRHLVAGAFHTCAIVDGATEATTDDRVRCWGANDQGQIGDGFPAAFRTSPVQIPSLLGVRFLSAGTNHACVIMSNDDLRCWGDNANGQLGTGTRADRSTPTLVAAIQDIETIHAGGRSTCAIVGNFTPTKTSDDTAFCWGDNTNGQLGITPAGDVLVPPATGIRRGVTNLSLGRRHVCATMTGGTGVCWGHNDKGQLGDGTLQSTSLPRSISA